MSENLNKINWYPGHMAKTKRQLKEQMKRVDLVLEVCDARLPNASRNPDMDGMLDGKTRLLFLNKSDLADPETSQRWLRYYKGMGQKATLVNASRLRGSEIVNLINSAVQGSVERALARGIHKTVRAMIVGIPNVGKSTLINHLCGRNISQTGDRPGVTRSNQWVKVSPYLEILDTPGLLWPRLEDQIAARRLCYIGSIKDDVLDLYEITIHLLEDLCELIPERLAERYHLKNTDAKGVALLDAVCSGRGWLLKGNQYDYDRCCSVVLDEFRGGKLGRITLELPPPVNKEIE